MNALSKIALGAAAGLVLVVGAGPASAGGYAGVNRCDAVHHWDNGTGDGGTPHDGYKYCAGTATVRPCNSCLSTYDSNLGRNYTAAECVMGDTATPAFTGTYPWAGIRYWSPTACDNSHAQGWDPIRHEVG
jgi:hypothetical protein